MSPSVSVSPSISPSISPSVSPSLSPSPSPGWQDYTRGNYAVLPIDDTDLENTYTVQDLIDVSTKNDVWVTQNAIGEYAVHLYKDYAGTTDSINLEWEGQTNLSPSLSPVLLQIYNRNLTSWETIDSDNTSPADTDFTLTANKTGLANYKDVNTVIACRIYQEGI